MGYEPTYNSLTISASYVVTQSMNLQVGTYGSKKWSCGMNISDQEDDLDSKHSPAVLMVSDLGGLFPKLGYLFRNPYNKDYGIWGCILGS